MSFLTNHEAHFESQSGACTLVKDVGDRHCLNEDMEHPQALLLSKISHVSLWDVVVLKQSRGKEVRLKLEECSNI